MSLGSTYFCLTHLPLKIFAENRVLKLVKWFSGHCHHAGRKLPRTAKTKQAEKVASKAF